MKKNIFWPPSAIASVAFLTILCFALGFNLWKSNRGEEQSQKELIAPKEKGTFSTLEQEGGEGRDKVIPVLLPGEDEGIRVTIQSSRFSAFTASDSFSYAITGEIEAVNREIHGLTLSFSLSDVAEEEIFAGEVIAIDIGDAPLFPGETLLFDKLFYGEGGTPKPDSAIVAIGQLSLENAAEEYGPFPGIPVTWRTERVQGTDIGVFIREDHRTDSLLGSSINPVILIENTGRRTISLLLAELRIHGGGGEIIGQSERYITSNTGAAFRSGKKVPLEFYFMFKERPAAISGYTLYVKDVR